ncbi:MAG: methyltransferase domain-containing protein [bacterium]|nr:methyltransferase domain-containing protein [bacterium]
MLKGGSSLINPASVITHLDIRDGDIVADLGCGGAGHFIGPLAQAVGAKGIVYAVDIQKNILQVVQGNMEQQNITNVTTVWSDLERAGGTDIPKESCSVVFLVNVLFQNKQHQTIVQEAGRMVVSGGRLVIIDWKPTGSPFGPPSDHRLSPLRVIDIAKTFNFSLLEEFDAGPYHYALVFKK